jgi:pimeloyl-ACP methyl ester carboxylesterase
METWSIRIPSGDAGLDGDLALPPAARGLVVFAHGSGSSRHSPRNRQVAQALQQAGLGTLLIDLLTADEEQVDRRTRELRFDIPLLAGRLTGAVDLLAGEATTRDLPVVLFGASTGAAAALMTAADRPGRVRGVISRGGRPDLAGDALRHVEAPVLLVVGGADDPIVHQLNERAAAIIPAPIEMVVVPGAGHLFEEPGAMQTVVERSLEAIDHWLRSAATGVAEPDPDGPA